VAVVESATTSSDFKVPVTRIGWSSIRAETLSTATAGDATAAVSATGFDGGFSAVRRVAVVTATAPMPVRPNKSTEAKRTGAFRDRVVFAIIRFDIWVLLVRSAVGTVRRDPIADHMPAGMASG
jgi:hypothetical protein